MLIEQAYAKINLCLHVIGQRPDGMHLLDSIVVFAKIGDVLTVDHADSLTLEVTGKFGAGLSNGPDNLILKAAALLGVTQGNLRLKKNLPVASGIGGGSADCAAAVRLLCALYDLETPDPHALAGLGSDVPVCLAQTPQRMMGIGGNLGGIPCLPKFWMVLVNAGIPVETGAVFGAMDKRDNPEIGIIPASLGSAVEFFTYLATLRNDMEAAAIKTCPAIKTVLANLNAIETCALARMSGSGGTCFGLFETREAAEAGAVNLQLENPKWWVVAAEV